jgi:hypothetical protein
MLDLRKNKNECTPEEWLLVSAARRESQYTGNRSLGSDANVLLRKPWGKLRKHPAVDEEFIFKGK